MSTSGLSIVILGMSITSSWANRHATTYRGLVRELEAQGHRVLFLERDRPWYAANRDLPEPPYGTTRFYSSVDELKELFASEIRNADAVIVGSCIPDGVEVGEWVQKTATGVTAFYDLDTAVTLAELERRNYESLSPKLISGYALYLSFTGGSTLRQFERHYGSPMARPLYGSFDPALYYPEVAEKKWDLGYRGTYCADRQPHLELLMLEPARRWQQGTFAIAGTQYPAMNLPPNVEHIDHLPPSEHRKFYNSQRFALNITRADMIRAGYSPGIRLFEAAACATPVISDYWHGLETFFSIGTEILVSGSPEETLNIMRKMPEEQRREIGENACRRVRSRHTAAHRAAELEHHICEAQRNRTRVSPVWPVQPLVFTGIYTGTVQGVGSAAG